MAPTPEQKQTTQQPEKPSPKKGSKWPCLFAAVMLGTGSLAAGCQEYVREDGTWVGSPSGDHFPTPPPPPGTDQKETPGTDQEEADDERPNYLRERIEEEQEREEELEGPPIIINIVEDFGDRVLVEVQPNQTIFSLLGAIGIDNPGDYYDLIEEWNPHITSVDVVPAYATLMLPALNQPPDAYD